MFYPVAPQPVMYPQPMMHPQQPMRFVPIAPGFTAPTAMPMQGGFTPYPQYGGQYSPYSQQGGYPQPQNAYPQQYPQTNNYPHQSHQQMPQQHQGQQQMPQQHQGSPYPQYGGQYGQPVSQTQPMNPTLTQGTMMPGGLF